jgi:hypothetical protein
VVDRFLAAKKTQTAPSPTPAPPRPAESAPVIVPFVCENDVREAIRESRKIYIGPKTIITPSARDVGDQFGILVLAQRLELEWGGFVTRWPISNRPPTADWKSASGMQSRPTHPKGKQ